MRMNGGGGWLGSGNATDEGVRMVSVNFVAGRIRMGLTLWEALNGTFDYHGKRNHSLVVRRSPFL